MKKKILSILLCGFLLISLTGCGNESKKENNDIKATITNNSGTTETLSAKDLMTIYDENQAKFNRDYKGAKITFIGTVKSVDIGRDVIVKSDSITTKKNRIVFEEGFCLVLDISNTTYDLADYSKGDKLEVTTGIAEAKDLTSEALKNVIDERAVWLIGNDKLCWNLDDTERYCDSAINDIKTEIIKK